MDVGPEPSQHRDEIALADSLHQLGLGCPRGGEQLGGGHGAKGVGGKIAKAATVPVNVLKATKASIGHIEAEQFLHAVIPGAGNIGHLHIPGDQRRFHSVAEQDVGGICHLVRIDPDKAGFDMGVGAEDILRLPRRTGAAERLTHQRGEIGDEGPAAASLHLEDEGLAFMHRHAAGAAYGLAEPIAGAALFVQRMAAFVQHAHEGGGEIRLVVTGGDPHVVGGAAAERMGADVEPSARRVETNHTHEPLADGLLDIGGKRTVEPQDRAIRGLVIQNFGQ